MLARQVLGIVLATVLLAGCGEVEFSSEFSEEGTAVHTFAASFPRDDYEQVVTGDLEETLSATIAAAIEAGFHVERVFTGDTVTLLISTSVDNARDVGAALNSLLNASGIGTPAGISTAFAGEFRQETPAAGGTRFVLDMTVDGQELYDTLAALATGGAPAVSRQDILQSMQVSYVAHVPGKIHETTGVSVEDDTARWDISPSATTRIYAESNTGGLGSTTLFIVAAILSVAAVIALAVLVGLALIRRPGLSGRLVAGSGHFPQRTTINREGLWLVKHARRFIDGLWRRSGSAGQPPLSDEALVSQEGEPDGADAEGDRPVASIHRR